MQTINKQSRIAEFQWSDGEVYQCRVSLHYSHGDSPRKYIIALGDMSKAMPTTVMALQLRP